jgi:hypothetical protein
MMGPGQEADDIKAIQVSLSACPTFSLHNCVETIPPLLLLHVFRVTLNIILMLRI